MRTMILFTLLSFHAFGQDWKDVETATVKGDLANFSRKMAEPEIILRFTKKTFQHFTDTEPEEQTSGVVIVGENKNYRSEIDGMLTIQNDQISLTVDSSAGKVYIMRRDSLLYDKGLTGFLNGSFNEYSVKQRSSGNLKYYLITPPDIKTQQTIQLTINTENELQELVLFMPEANYYRETIDDETTEIPKVVVSYSKPQHIDTEKTGSFSVKNWVIKTESGYRLSESIETNYLLHDLRYENKK